MLILQNYSDIKNYKKLKKHFYKIVPNKDDSLNKKQKNKLLKLFSKFEQNIVIYFLFHL